MNPEFFRRYGFAGLLALCLVFTASSCDEQKPQGQISLGSEKVNLNKGSVFISIVSEKSWELSVSYEGEQKDWIKFNRSSGSGSTNSIIMSYTRNDADDPRHAVITARFPGSESSVRFTQTGLSAVISDAPRGWMELPATDTEQEGFTWTWHDMDMGTNKTFRNYSLYYSQEDMISLWVAYPLNQGLIGTGSRTDEWAYDPKIPAGFQAALKEGSYKGDYDRGHQLPSADRLRKQANEQTFYSTNMTPQRSDFNQKIWGVVEGKVRAWMSAFDTLYVVTGCVPSADDFTTDRIGNKINIPSAYYKALLGYNKATDTLKERYAGIAIYLDHEIPGDTPLVKSMGISISELESRVGINFFVNLPKEFAEVETVVSDRFPF